MANKTLLIPLTVFITFDLTYQSILPEVLEKAGSLATRRWEPKLTRGTDIVRGTPLPSSRETFNGSDPASMGKADPASAT
jgi:hypothetical protein